METHLSTPTPVASTRSGIEAGQRAEVLTEMLQLLIAASEQILPEQRELASVEENLLVQVRLGIASSLFAALRSKHLETAAHSFRVGLMCSSWASHLGLNSAQRDALEVAALLHDVGKIGVPDAVLLKPGALTPDEEAVMAQHLAIGHQILKCSCSSPAVLEIVANYGTWYDGSIKRGDVCGLELPLGSRILAIVDAFDSMTSHQLYREALSRDGALQELYRFAGRQFDPELVARFRELVAGEPVTLCISAARTWLKALDYDLVHSRWRLNQELTEARPVALIELFEQTLLGGINDGVIFIDRGQRIVLWNRGAEQLTGLAATAVHQRQWLPHLVELSDEHGHALNVTDCPILHALVQGELGTRRLRLRGRHGHPVPVHLHVLPVLSADGVNHGVVVVVHDISGEANLAARCQSLHEQATRDPLTQVANRAEFDRVHELFVQAHQQHHLPCSLIITDIDHFKSINDTFGHPVGDEVIRSYARLLKGSCRPGDLVARYGGEEFVLLCADCDNTVASERAEQIRRALSELPIDGLNGRRVTATYGVTAIQDGDTAETMLNRADRALLVGKERGRNCVIQFGTGPLNDGAAAAENELGGPALIAQEMVTYVPQAIAWEKLRGFTADHGAEVLATDENRVRLKIGTTSLPFVRRDADRKVPLVLEIFLDEQGDNPMHQRATRIELRISLYRSRERRRDEALSRARTLLASFRAYMMATADGAPIGGISDT
ncbi:MAG: diguanylate cyclase [Pirellulales bacterium]|nr:diguanylate cyclase [Pirellulales bacterium]